MKIEMKIKPTITQQRINYYIYFGVLVIAIIILMFTTSFLYKNFYQTITESEVILILKSKVANEMVDTEKFDLIIEKIKQKTTHRDMKIENNPFERK